MFELYVMDTGAGLRGLAWGATKPHPIDRGAEVIYQIGRVLGEGGVKATPILLLVQSAQVDCMICACRPAVPRSRAVMRAAGRARDIPIMIKIIPRSCNTANHGDSI